MFVLNIGEMDKSLSTVMILSTCNAH